MSILAVYREPFGFEPHVQRLPEGETLAAMRARMRGLPLDFDARGIICVNGRPAPRALWGAITPKAPAVTEVTFHCPPMSGGGDDGKNVFALVASIALTVATGFIAGGGLVAKFGLSASVFGAGKVGALLLAGGVSLAGSLLLSALIPPPTIDQQTGKKTDTPGASSASGNVLDPNGPIPRVIGEFKVFPPLAAEPLTYFDGPDEIVEAVYCLSGPHRIEDIRIGQAPIDSMPDVEFEIREGWPGDSPISLTRRQARTEGLQTELRGFTVSDTDGRTLESTTGDTSAALPQVQVMATRDAPDEQWLHIAFPQGLHKNASETTALRVPIRIRLREVGDTTWVQLPELHFQAANIRQMRATVKLVFTDDATTTPGAANNEGWVEARVAAPGQTVAPSQPDWAAHAYFDKGGDDWLSANNLGSTGVDHVILDRYAATIYLDTATFPKGRYEVEIRRGAAFLNSTWSASAYTVSSVIWDLFGYQGTPGKIVMSREGIADTLYLLRSVSVWNAHPVPTDDLALIAVRARNRALDSVSCLAGGYVPDWDGSAWTAWAVTDNPAPHLRDIWAGAQNVDPLPGDVIDDANLVAWRTACTTLGYACNAIVEGKTVDEAARIVASCGYAKPYMAEIWGVSRDYDRSGEAPVQLFTPRNMTGFQWTKAFPRLPDGFRVNYRDAAREYEPRQITVFRPGASDDSGLIEQVTYEGHTVEADVRARADYDLAQPSVRGTFYSFDAPVESIVCRRGDLVGVQHDMLTSWAGGGRVTDVEEDGLTATAIHLDEEVPVESEPDVFAITDWFAVKDVFALGKTTGVALRRADGSVTVHALSNPTGSASRLEFAAPVTAAGINGGALAAVGRLGSEYLRLIVFSVLPRPDLEASLTLVDEAAELWT